MSPWEQPRYHRFMHFPDLPLVVLDTETTGLTPRVHKIIEFACVRIKGGRIADEYQQLIQPKCEIPPHVEVLTRIRTADLQGQPTFDDVRERIVQRIGKESILVGQNIPYDLAMLKGEGIDLSGRPWIDTSMLASLVFPELESYSLSYLSTVLKLNHEPVHRALGDVCATAELLGKCWERLQELPESLLAEARTIMEKAPEGYRRLFAELPRSKAKQKPAWLTLPATKASRAANHLHDIALQAPGTEHIMLIEEPPAPGVLESIVRSAAADTTHVDWVAVKNLESAVARMPLPSGVRVLHPPFLLLDTATVARFLAQDTFTTDEATLAVKLLWYQPQVQSDLPLHGEETSVWNGKLACTESSPDYTKQFADLPSAVLLDHRQILSFLADPEHSAHGALNAQAHIVIDDASMLEDTATKAYGWHCELPYLRAAAEGNPHLTKIADLASLWAERTRNHQDIRYITARDLETADVRGMCELLTQALADTGVSPLAQKQLSHLKLMLIPENLSDRIAYVELRPDGSLHLHSVPERIGSFLQQHLYGTYPTTLLIPPGSGRTLHEILPHGTRTTVREDLHATIPFRLSYAQGDSLEQLLASPPPGKTIVLCGSKRSIDDVYIRHAEAMEQQGVTLICQGLCGGAGRMRANFIAAEGTALWFLTPWSYEGISLPPGEADRLVLQSLPFDHPSHAVLSRRAEHYQNAFTDYSLARLTHRLFRILRTFSGHCKQGAPVLLLDERIHSKSYGKDIRKYLEKLAPAEQETAAVQTPLF